MDTGMQSLKAASAISQYVPVGPLVAGSELDETVIRAGSYNVLPIGMTIATVPTYGQPVAAEARRGYVTKGIAAASLGAFSPIAVGSTNGHLIPLCPSGLTAHIASAGDVPVRYIVGYAQESAADGDVIRIVFDPQQIL
jgi:hypothetical protein